MVSSSAIATANAIGMLKSQQVLAQRAGGMEIPYDIRVRTWYNPDGITAYFMVPAILGIIVTMTMVMMTSMGIVRERERGTLEQLIVTPIKSYELMIGKIIPYIALGYLQITVALLVGAIVFAVPIREVLFSFIYLPYSLLPLPLVWGCLFLILPKTKCRPCRCRFLFFCPAFYFRALCSHGRLCPR
ncbi:hypothetical protein N752_01660 [Desulforamulus aquiferis]|nr:hypothetical protein N752_01660 [Desulforamulus aquiferis]